MSKDGKEFNFIRSNSERDKELFFGPLNENDSFNDIDDNWLMAHIMFKANLFSSVSQARKNGGNITIPSGFLMHTIGKYKTLITILNINK